MVSAIEAYEPTYSNTPTVRSVAFKGDEDVTVFPLSDIEMKIIAGKWRGGIEDYIKSLQKSLASAKEELSDFDQLFQTRETGDSEDETK